jgi:L-threonylcarbamoyladenylate synthase
MREIACSSREDLPAAAAAAVGAAIRAGEVLLFPTDTLYGLGVDPGSEAALDRLFRLKGRDPGKPVPVLLADASLVGRFAAAIPAPWPALMERFWPGPLTLVFPARAGLPAGIRSAAGAVALRVPGSALCRSVLRAAGGSLTGTSANVAGSGGTGDAAAALRALGAGVDLFVNAGTLPPSPASTLVDLDAAGEVLVLRRGAVPEVDLRRSLGGNTGASGRAGSVDNPPPAGV